MNSMNLSTVSFYDIDLENVKDNKTSHSMSDIGAINNYSDQFSPSLNSGTYSNIHSRNKKGKTKKKRSNPGLPLPTPFKHYKNAEENERD